MEWTYTKAQVVIPSTTKPMRPVGYRLDDTLKNLTVEQVEKTVGFDMGGGPVQNVLLAVEDAERDALWAIINVIIKRNAAFTNVPDKATTEAIKP